jgi:hypothetical protein
VEHLGAAKSLPDGLPGELLPSLQCLSTQGVPTRSAKPDGAEVVFLEIRELHQGPVCSRQPCEHRDLMLANEVHHIRRAKLGKQ